MTSQSKLIAALAVLGLAAPAFAQKAQPWKQPWGSVESRIQFCPTGGPPTPMPRMAFDDFVCDNTGPISWLYWWGVVLDPAQLQQKPFYIAIHANQQSICPPLSTSDPCGPGARLAFWCVIPTWKYVGLDCQQRRVYRFRAKLSPVFTQVAGTHYWLTIAEVDQASARVGVEDFRWSGFRKSTADPHNHCPAQFFPTVAATCRIFDTCQQETDLSFELHRNIIVVHPNFPLTLRGPLSGQIDIRPLTADANSDSMISQLVDLDDDGTGMLDEELPDGQYRISFQGMGSGRQDRLLQIDGGMPMADSFFDVFVGDVNNDGVRNGLDVQPFINGLLQP